MYKKLIDSFSNIIKRPQSSSKSRRTRQQKTYPKSSIQTRSATSKQQSAIAEFRKQRATRKIQTLMKSRKIPEARAHFLNTICSDSGVCIAFGKQTNMIKKHFNGFVDFTYVSEIMRIGNPSDNGFVNEFTYKREGYEANAILKSSMKAESDNLFYEYLVGQYINKLNLNYPCFLETYGLYQYKTDKTWQFFKSNRRIPSNIAKAYIELQPEKPTEKSFTNSCMNSRNLCILIQHINQAKTLKSMLGRSDFNDHHLLYVLYQVYMPLAMNADTFTHYDLHRENVLMYEPVKGKYIQYHYHINNRETITFKCCYIAKIIDYGRSYFVDNDSPNTMTKSAINIYNKICSIKSCDTRDSNCGYEYGYSTHSPENPPGSFFFISSIKRNMSHDLRLLYEITMKNIHNIADRKLKMLLRSVQYGFIDDEHKFELREQHYGTVENTELGLEYNNINNVIDAHDALKELIPHFQKSNDEYFKNHTKLGDLHIYADGSRPMEFIEASASSEATTSKKRLSSIDSVDSIDE
jgi:hypothetical protein